MSVARIHGNRSQAQRTLALDGFKSGKFQVLVATDIVARGIDVEELSHVVNFDVPNVPDDYIHRVGRTARADATGDAFTFVSPDEESDLRAIERAVGRPLPRITVSGFNYDQRPAERFEVPIGERIAAIRARRADERKRAKEKAERRTARETGNRSRAPRRGRRNVPFRTDARRRRVRDARKRSTERHEPERRPRGPRHRAAVPREIASAERGLPRGQREPNARPRSQDASWQSAAQRARASDRDTPRVSLGATTRRRLQGSGERTLRHADVVAEAAVVQVRDRAVRRRLTN